MSHPLEKKIGSLRNRVRRLVTLHGACWVVGAVVTAVLAVGLTDYLLRFEDRGIRTICSAIVLGAFGWTSYRYLYLGLTASLGDVELAQRVQRRFPTLGDSLASTVEFLKQSEDDPTAGSVALRRAVIAQTTAETERLDFQQTLQSRSAVRAAMAMTAICLLGLILVVLNPLASRTAVARLANPFGTVGWPQTYHLTLLDEITRVARGREFQIEVVDADGLKLPPDVHVDYRFRNGDGTVTEESHAMRPVHGTVVGRQRNARLVTGSPGTLMIARRENIRRPFSYRIEGGDDRSMGWIEVEIIEPPSMESVTARLTPPDYTGWPIEKAEKLVTALIGTRMTLSGRSTKPLESARLAFDGGGILAGRVSGVERKEIEIDFFLGESGACWLELTDTEGFTGGDQDRWELRVVADGSPSVSIERPSENVYVTPQAIVPIRVAAKDDLGLRRIDLEFTRSDRPDEAAGRQPLYEGPQKVPPREVGLSGGADLGESRVASYRWPLDQLDLAPGMEITLHGTAADYLPQTGISQPRRLIVIGPEELGRRIADRQTLILEELARVLQMQRQARQQVSDLEIRLDQLGLFEQRDVDHLRGVEISQRQISRSLTGPSEGIPIEIEGLLADLENNRLDSPDVERRMQSLLAEIERLGREHLPIIAGELTSAIKASQVRLQAEPPEATPDEAVGQSLATAGVEQDAVIASLERLLGDLARWDSYRRFHRDLSQLLQDQDELGRRTTELARRTLTKNLDELPPKDRSELKIVTARQIELARRLDRIEHEMQQAIGPLEVDDPLAAETLSDALFRARELAIASGMRSVGDLLELNRLGQVFDRQTTIEEQLQEVLDILANRREHELARRIDKLREAESDLADLARREEDLERQLDQTDRDMDRIAEDQEQLRAETERMARRLERLAAEGAAQSVDRATEKMQQAGQAAKQSDAEQAKQQAAEAKKDLDAAKDQLAEERRRAEAERAGQQLERLAETLQGMLRRQERITAETGNLADSQEASGQLTRLEMESVQDLADRQRALHGETVELATTLVEADIFRMTLFLASLDMALAAGRLDRLDTDLATREAQQNAQTRLAQLVEALEPEPPTDPPDADPEADAGAGQGAGEGQADAPGDARQTLAELKLLKLMQLEINRRTKDLEKSFGTLDVLPPEARPLYDKLSDEQRRLSELLLKLLTPPEEPPRVDPNRLRPLQNEEKSI